MLGLYVHWPFCKKKCPYCDFNSHVRRKDIDQAAYRDALLADLQFEANRIKAHNNDTLSSIFFGGGTPSLMPPATVQAVIDMAQSLFSFAADIEITLEANPTSSDAEKFKAFKSAGVNRLSLGVQSLKDADLKKLGREHTAKEALQVVDVMQHTFSRWSFDLLYAREGQTLEEWQQELEQAIQYIGGHVSLYQLTVEDGTEFKRRFDRGTLILPGEDSSTEMYMYTTGRLQQLGYVDYEVSNYAKPGDEAQHNLLYWCYGQYIGIGAGAHGRITTQRGKWATEREYIPERWCRKAPNNYVKNTILDTTTQVKEFVLMGLRLKKGIAESKLYKLFGYTFADIFIETRVRICIRENLLVMDDESLRTTLKGRLTLDAILRYILL